MDREGWWAPDPAVAKSQTRLSTHTGKNINLQAISKKKKIPLSHLHFFVDFLM